MLVQSHEYTKKNFKQGNCVVCELYLNKTFLKNSLDQITSKVPF